MLNNLIINLYNIIIKIITIIVFWYNENIGEPKFNIKLTKSGVINRK